MQNGTVSNSTKTEYLVRRRNVRNLTGKNRHHHHLHLHHFHRSALPLLYIKTPSPHFNISSHPPKTTLKDSTFTHNFQFQFIMCFSSDFCTLPTDCVTKIISLTSPPDACRLAIVSNVLKSVSESDQVWEKFLPSDLLEVMARSDSGSASVCQCLLLGFSKKQLFFRLSEFPLLIDSGLKSFFLDKWTGKKCYMISARDLDIVWGDTPSYWNWTPLPESMYTLIRFRNFSQLNFNFRH